MFFKSDDIKILKIQKEKEKIKMYKIKINYIVVHNT